ncbi:MAG: hypothetical protein AB7C91_12925 [Sphaerochaeta sp.]|uniref:hypothetical protein n=1 Tax=Sphaerochaeta sp. TaxID=1972642 RepID=UPI003D0CCDAF
MAVLLLVGAIALVGCDGNVDTSIKWKDIATEWTDSNQSQLSYVDQSSSIHIDLGYYETPSDSNSWVMCYFPSFEYANDTLTASYTSQATGESEQGPYQISIKFSYSNGVLTAVCSGSGPLAGRTFSFVPA